MANNLLQQQLANQAYNPQPSQGWAIYPQGSVVSNVVTGTITSYPHSVMGGAGTGTLTPYPYGGVLIQTGSGGYISGSVAQQLDPYVPYVTIDTRVEFSEEEIMRAEQIMEECDAARTP